MSNDALVGWKRLPPGDAARSLGPVADVQYGPDVVTESELRLLGTSRASGSSNWAAAPASRSCAWPKKGPT